MLNNKIKNAPRFPWSDQDTQYLLDNYHLKTIKDIGLIINKPSQAVVFKSRRMGITNVPMQRALREGNYEKALEIYKKTGFFCHFLTTKFGHEKSGYQSIYNHR
jgi:hypothetical protein